MAAIRKRGERWQVQVRRKGYPLLSKCFLKKSDAQEWARFTEHQIDRRSLPYDPRRLDGITLKALLEKYRDEVVPRKRSPDREINLLNAFIARSPKLAALPLSAVTAAHFCTYRDIRLKTVKPATVCRELGLIQHAYDIATKEWDYPLQVNPVAKVKKPEIRNRRERRLPAMLLASCSNIMGRPEIVMANPKSITVSYEPILFTQEAMDLVQGHCAQYERAAVRTMTNDAPLKTETFECK